METLEEQKNQINKTRIIFNSNFKNFINKLKEDNEELLKKTRTATYYILEIIQEEIREWIILNQDLLTFCWNKEKIDNSNKSMPDYFVIFISLLIDLNHCYSWSDIFENFKKFKDTNITFDMSNNEIEDNEYEQTESCCLCSHNCYTKNMAIIYNPYSEIRLWIAGDCFKKIGIMTKTEFQKKVREARPKIMKAFKEKKELEKKIKKDLELEKIYRRCCACNELNILHIEPYWKKRCNKCYFEFKYKDEINVCLLKLPDIVKKY